VENLLVAGAIFPSNWSPMHSQRSILIVDHDEDLLLRLEHLLESAGFATTVTWRADHLNDLLTNSTYDLVVIGHHPPDMDAARVLRHAACGPRPACIVLNPQDQYPFEAEYFYSLGAHAVMSKWSPEIAERVRQLFRPAESARSAWLRPS
jgi:DNA-binding response OmpR family regulator